MCLSWEPELELACVGSARARITLHGESVEPLIKEVCWWRLRKSMAEVSTGSIVGFCPKFLNFPESNLNGGCHGNCVNILDCESVQWFCYVGCIVCVCMYV